MDKTYGCVMLAVDLREGEIVDVCLPMSLCCNAHLCKGYHLSLPLIGFIILIELQPRSCETVIFPVYLLLVVTHTSIIIMYSLFLDIVDGPRRSSSGRVGGGFGFGFGGGSLFTSGFGGERYNASLTINLIWTL